MAPKRGNTTAKKAHAVVNEKSKPAKAPKAAKASKEAPPVLEEPRWKRRQLSRRETDEQTQRFIDRKLSHVPPAILETVQNLEGLRVRDFIKRELKRTKSVNGRLASKFMVNLYEEYDLGSGIFSGLPEPEGDESVDEELLDLMGQCHDENPVLRNPKPLAKYLEVCRPLTYTNLQGLMNGIVEGALLSHNNAQKLQVAALGYIARAACVLISGLHCLRGARFMR